MDGGQFAFGTEWRGFESLRAHPAIRGGRLQTSRTIRRVSRRPAGALTDYLTDYGRALVVSTGAPASRPTPPMWWTGRGSRSIERAIDGGPTCRASQFLPESGRLVLRHAAARRGPARTNQADGRSKAPTRPRAAKALSSPGTRANAAPGIDAHPIGRPVGIRPGLSDLSHGRPVGYRRRHGSSCLNTRSFPTSRRLRSSHSEPHRTALTFRSIRPRDTD
jgi:hypothetical protein